MTKFLRGAQVCLNRTQENTHLLIVSIYYLERRGEEQCAFDKFYTPGMNFQNHLLFDLSATFYYREFSKYFSLHFTTQGILRNGFKYTHILEKYTRDYISFTIEVINI